MKAIELKDFLEYKFLNNIGISPDKSSAIFGVAMCDEENNGYKQNIYLWRDGKCIPLTQSGKDSGAMYLDADTVLFKSARESSDEVKTVFYKMSLSGGEAQKYFEIPLAVSKIEQMDKDEFVLIASYDKDFSYVGREDKKDDLLKAKKEAADYEVFTKIPFCHNGGGYAKNTSSRLYTYNVVTESLKQISPEGLEISTFALKEDKKQILVIAEIDKKRVSMETGLYEYTFEAETWKEIVPEKDYSIDAVFYFDNEILFVGNKEVSHGCNENGRFFKVDAEGKITLFCDNEESLHGSVGSDCRFGGGISMKVDGDKLYFISTRVKDAHLMSLNTNGEIKEELIIDGSVDCFDVKDGNIYFVAMKDGNLQEIYKKAENVEQLTKLNEAVLADKYVAPYEEVVFENDGWDFKGWVLLPKDYDPNKKYPAILDIHGGPKTVYGTTFYHEMQLWANMGYFVFFTNPRGGDGRGNEFLDIFGKYGTIDYDDLMKFTDVVLEKYPSIDASKVGVTGGSYGGFMTNWIVGHTDRFACAATQRSISNWISFYGTSDIGMFFAEDQIHGNIFDNVEKLWEHSPLKYAKNIVTPTLFIHSDEDFRCPLEQATQFYTAMVDRGIEARFVLFHGENHELSRSGKPKHRIRRLEEITNWMETYLK